MNTPELIYKTITFFFSNLWIYIGLLLLILTLRGDITKTLSGIKDFFKKTALKYKEKQEKADKFSQFKERIVEKEEWKK